MIPITEYISKLGNQGVASPNRYWIEVTMPRGVQGNAFNSVNVESLSGAIQAKDVQWNSGPDLSMKCLTMQFPARSITTIENRHTGAPYKLPYAASYDEVTFTFVASADLRERQFFEVWQEAAINVNINSLNFYEEYISQARLMQLDKNNNVTYSVTLFEVYPINIGAVDYSYATTDEIVPVSVTLTYKRWANDAFSSRRSNA